MASTYSTNLKLELIGTGEQSGVWGTTTNTNMGTAIEQAIVGKGSPVFSTDADLTLTLSNSSAAQTARAFVLNVTSGVSLTTTRNLVVPTIEKPYVVMNNTTGGQSIVVKTAAGSGITVPNGGQVFLYVDGTNVIQMLDAFGDLTYTGTLTGGTGVVNLGSGQFVKDASGNVGVSVTPSTWNASIKALSVGRAGSSVYSFTGSNIVGLTCNASYIASDWTYVSTDAATRYQQNAGLHTWYTAPSGTAGNPITFTTAMTLDASGNLGLGVTPSAWSGGKGFQVERASVFGVASLGGFASNLYLADAGANYRCIANGTVALYLQNVAGDHRWSVGSGTAGNIVSPTIGMTLDASGKLQLGATAPATFDMALLSGTNATANDLTLFGPSTSQVRLQFSRSGASGRGEIGYNMATDVMRLVTSGADRVLVDASGNTTPGANGTQAFGSTSLRWSQVWCTAGAFNTSDARLKTVPVSFTAKEVAAAKALSKEIGLYQWLESVEAKGADKARQHVGLTVQRAEQVLKDHGLDPWRYGFMSYDKWDDVTVDHPATEAIEAVDAVLDDEGNVVTPAVEAVPAKDAWTEVTLKAGEAYAFRYDQLNLFISRGLNAEIEAMQAQLDEQNTAMQMLATRLAALEQA